MVKLLRRHLQLTNLIRQAEFDASQLAQLRRKPSVIGPTNQQSSHMEVDDGSDDDDAFNYYGLLSPDELDDLVENQRNSDSESDDNDDDAAQVPPNAKWKDVLDVARHVCKSDLYA